MRCFLSHLLPFLVFANSANMKNSGLWISEFALHLKYNTFFQSYQYAIRECMHNKRTHPNFSSKMLFTWTEAVRVCYVPQVPSIFSRNPVPVKSHRSFVQGSPWSRIMPFLQACFVGNQNPWLCPATSQKICRHIKAYIWFCIFL